MIKNIKLIYILFFLALMSFLNSCAVSPGISEKPNIIKNSSVNSNINILLHDLGEMDFSEISNLNSGIKKDTDAELIKDFYGFYDYEYDYQLGGGDEININLTDTDDIDGNYLIDPSGDIDLPYVGKINVKNKGAEEAQSIITNVLKKYYVNPDLQLDIVTFASSKVYVTGTVRNQLIIDLDDKPMRILDAIIKANINTTGNDNLSSTSGVIRRDGAVYKMDLKNAITGIDERKNFFLKKDDVIFIDRNPDSILVFGEANIQGSFFPYAGYNLTQVLSDSGINNLTADAKEIFVIRENYDEELTIDVYKINVKNPVNLVAGKYFNLEAKDIVYIPASDIVKWNRVISLLLPQTDLFKSYNPIIQNGLDANSVNVQ